MTTKIKLKPLPKDFAALRIESGLNQAAFWGRYAVTQSGGSRIENGRKVSPQLAMLIRLHLSDVISDEQLKAAK